MAVRDSGHEKACYVWNHENLTMCLPLIGHAKS